jgi:hypothetical protein
MVFHISKPKSLKLHHEVDTTFSASIFSTIPLARGIEEFFFYIFVVIIPIDVEKKKNKYLLFFIFLMTWPKL